MSLNQQLREPRVLAILTPRLIALMAFVAAALRRGRLQVRAAACAEARSRRRRLPRTAPWTPAPTT